VDHVDSPRVDVTVALCTWNRARLLDGALRHLTRLRVPAGLRFELVVVDNGSSDDTGAVLAGPAAPLPLRRPVEPRPRVSPPRNRALEVARGDLILWVDDDVRVNPDWLRAYVEAAWDWPDASFFGGPIEPVYAVTPPSWARWHDVIEGPFAALDLGGATRPLADAEVPFGCNMGFRRAALAGRRFDARLGRFGTQMGGGEEIELIEELRRAGHRGVWVAPARVEHWIPAHRLTAGYLWSYHYGRGRSLLRCEAPEGRRLFRVPWSCIRRAAASQLAAWCLAPLRTRRWAQALEEAAFTRGKIARLRRGLPEAGGSHGIAGLGEAALGRGIRSSESPP